jgi:TfoX/Sxy family transcriptional regulator of competence genes
MEADTFQVWKQQGKASAKLATSCQMQSWQKPASLKAWAQKAINPKATKALHASAVFPERRTSRQS